MNKEHPIVTIITATFNLIKANRKETFIQMVKSVQEQTYKNIEHIIVDGGSKDGTIELIESLGLRYISEPDDGLFHAMNKGINLAQGKYINFMNSDDYFNNNKAVELSVKLLEKNNADFSFADINILDENDKIYEVKKPDLQTIYSMMPFGHQSMFTRTDVLKKENGFDLSYKSASDYDLILRLFLKRYKYVQLKDNIVNFRGGGVSQINFKTACLDVVSIFKKNYSPYLNLSDTEWEKIFFVNALPFKLLLKIGVKTPMTYFRYFLRIQKFNTKRFRKNLIQFHLSSKKENMYLKVLNKWIIKPEHYVEINTLEDYIKTIK